MKLIARKPCNFGGKQFFIGDEVPSELVMDVTQQEKWGVLSVMEISEEASAEQASALTQKQSNGRKIAKDTVKKQTDNLISIQDDKNEA